MKVKDLLDKIEREKEKSLSFLEWDVYTEQLDEVQKQSLKAEGNSFTDSEDWEYYKCFGFWTMDRKNKRFTVNVNY